VGHLIDHVDGLSTAFTAAAKKEPLPTGNQGPSADAARLGPDWRARVPDGLESLAAAWREQAARTGSTEVGGMELRAEMAGVIALNEITVHGWDVAVASGQKVQRDPALLEAAWRFVQAAAAASPQGRPGLFGPPVPVSEAAPLADRLIALTGRAPMWAGIGQAT
jgi:uncharacterized protein (TIGR03086 family)